MSWKATKILMLEFQISKFAGNFNIENYNGAEGAKIFNI